MLPFGLFFVKCHIFSLFLSLSSFPPCCFIPPLAPAAPPNCLTRAVSFFSIFPMLALLLSSPFSRSSFPPSSSSFFSPRSPFPLWPNSSSSSSFSLSCETHNFSFFISRRRYINAHSFGRTVRLVIVFLVLFVPSLLWFFMFVFFSSLTCPCMHAAAWL